MTVDELKEWMDERFGRLDNSFEKLNGKVANHDKWLWFFRGGGAVILLALGYLLGT